MHIHLLLTRLDKLINIARSPRLLRALLKYRVLAGAEHRHIFLKNLATVIDIGANRGQFALAARRWSSKATIVSFEPLPKPAEMFRTLFFGDKMVKLHEAAIGTHPETRTMHVSARDDSSSLLPITSLQSKIFPGTGEVSTVMVRVAPLEAFVDLQTIIAPALLKLDVQGFEFEALCGCESALPRFDLIYCECSFVELYAGQKLAGDIIDWLSARGFRLKGIFNPAYDTAGQAIQADFLFGRSGAA